MKRVGPGPCTALPAFSRPPPASSDLWVSCPFGANSFRWPACPWGGGQELKVTKSGTLPEACDLPVRHPHLFSCSSCSSSCATLASKAVMEDLNLDLTWFSISSSLAFSSLFCLSICCRALSFFWAVLRSVCSSLLSWSTWRRCKRSNSWAYVALLYHDRFSTFVTCCALFLSLSLRISMLLCSSSSSSSSWAIFASRRRFSSAKADLRMARRHVFVVPVNFKVKSVALMSHSLSRGVACQLIGQFVSLSFCLLLGPFSCSQFLETEC